MPVSPCCARNSPPSPSTPTAGLSLGEFTAHAAAGTFDFETGLPPSWPNAPIAMQKAREETEGRAAWPPSSAARKIASANSPAAADVDVRQSQQPRPDRPFRRIFQDRPRRLLAKEYGARKAVELQVAGAFHSRLMESAYQSLSIALAETPMNEPSVPVVCNVDAQTVKDPETIRRTLADQVTGSVRWTESIEYLIDHLHCTQFLELGPGGVLAGLVGRIRKGNPGHFRLEFRQPSPTPSAALRLIAAKFSAKLSQCLLSPPTSLKRSST